MQLIVFVVVLVGLIGLLHWYLWKRLVRDATRPGTVRRIGTVAALVLMALVPATLIGGRALPPDTARWLAWPGYVWIALFFYLLVFLVLLEIPRAVLMRSARRRAAAPAAPEPVTVAAPTGERAETAATATIGTGDEDRARLIGRRLLIARSGAALAGAAAAGVVGYGMATALGGPRITPITVPLAKLPAGLDGLRIAVVSDIHLGPLLGRSHTERIVRVINEQQVDVVAVVGDLVDGTVAELGEAAAPLRDLTSTHGSFFVTGNHEYYSGATAWLAELERLGLTVLANERTEIRAGGGVLDLAGINDVSAGEEGRGGVESGVEGADFDRALGGRDESRPVVLLAHQPVAVDEAAARGVDLQLSGHTHGGQMFPFHGIVRLEQPALAGLSTVGGTRLFVTRGAGFWGPPVRVGAPPEVAVVRLTTG
ncbi:MAG TPA: metallophosphoesterase [Pseudonocardiaceae bacterium]